MKANVSTMSNVTTINNNIFLSNAHTIGGKKFVFLPVSELRIDAGYQRPLRSKVRRMVQMWNYDLCDVVLVSYRDGKFYVVDGQHRVEAARRVGVEMLACQLLEGLTRIDEARRFVAQNTTASTLSPYDTFGANLLLGDPIDTAIKEICDKWEIKIGTANIKSIARLGGLKEAREIVKCHGEKAFNWMLCVLHDAHWHLEIGGHSAIILKALREVYKEFNFTKHVVGILRGHTPRAINAMAQARYPEHTKDVAVTKYLVDTVGDLEAAAKKKSSPAA